jgi:hypothetical protein
MLTDLDDFHLRVNTTKGYHSTLHALTNNIGSSFEKFNKSIEKNNSHYLLRRAQSESEFVIRLLLMMWLVRETQRISTIKSPIIPWKRFELEPK